MKAGEKEKKSMSELSDAFWRFVSEHASESPAELMLRYGRTQMSFDLKAAVEQIECRRKTARKLPSFNACERFYYPSPLSAEQSSNEAVSHFHTSLIEAGLSVADLTAGLGIDAMTLAGKASRVDAFEMNESTNAALRHNANVLGLNNMRIMPPGDSIKMLADSDSTYDVIFIDPARRDANHQRTYALSDCAPDVEANLPLLRSRCKKLFIKASPMLDLSDCGRRLPGAAVIRAVSYRGECKEVLIEVHDDYLGEPRYEAVNITSEGERQVYRANGGDAAPSLIELRELSPGGYLYEPNASVMKLGSMASLTSSFPTLNKLDKNTNVYYSNEVLRDFPGRQLQIEQFGSINDRFFKSLKGERLNVISRNYPQSAEAIKKRLRLTDGGQRFLYCVRVAGNPMLLLCAPIPSSSI